MKVLEHQADAAPLGPQPSAPDLVALVERFRAAGLPVRTDGLTTALPGDAGLQLAVYRIVQEGLTNAVRHGEARTVQVEMQVEMQAQMRLDRTIDPQAALVIDIADDGRGPNGPVPGHGLLGLHERVQALGGTLALDRPEAGGLRLRVRLPIRPPVATEDRT